MNNAQRNKMSDLETKMKSLQNQFNDSEKVNIQLQSQLNDSNKLINGQQNKINDLETKINSLQNQINEAEKVNDLLKNQLNDSKSLNNGQQNKINDLENQIIQLQKQFIELRIKGEIVASVENELYINAEINLKTKSSTLDTSKSKVIISTSGAKYLGREVYEKGEPITSLHMKTSFACKSGTYYVRCIVFNREGDSKEIVSNSVTTSGGCLTFGYEGKAAKITLPQGQYKLEVWGAKGGDSTGKGQGNWYRGNGQVAKGGLGGYSRGILSLKEKETVYIYVGEEGHPSSVSDGSSTKGSFPDGGGTKTGHQEESYTTVPGTGGGSTSIRIGSDTDYARVIVAGGGGGASGDNWHVSPGGFGGGKSGGNCYNDGRLMEQGAGMQNGSTCGLGRGEVNRGDPGRFGSGATGKYKQRSDSGGGGGDGWYGGGSGGCGSGPGGSSGGGGSGWVFTEMSYKEWQSGDSENASKFTLSSKYYLTNAICMSGNEEFPNPNGNRTEHGHNGNGFAKITFE